MKKGIVIASFGTTHEDALKRTIDVIENKMREKYGFENCKRAFTSNKVREKLKTKKNLTIFNQGEALQSLKNKGFEKIFTMSLHILNGIEYKKLDNSFGKVSEPLLFNESDYKKIIENKEFNDTKGNDAIIFVGHGSEDASDESYEKLQNYYKKFGKENIFIGTIEGKITIKHILEKLKNTNFKKILLKPFLIVAGDHAKNDIMSNDKNSWKSILEKNGYKVETELVGMGEYPFIQKMFMDKFEKIYE
ncbi:sirohydrochlorin cobaltochelatase [Leptotrichia sp. oral taxon 847]|uniref:sirohydrochlorin cobaltochelatase n=1 Tax=Leptotrichia sp. oral taxon 847 TaxID=1785996 RepID=UPI000768187C|nr:sirohydrochlorin cobaltochelatase [Leptotrichia sp. oral taxon 847]AMD95101.1 cobalt chelatase [Leptotrichia sp. oral taxon 847]